jgi:hypothetical protein
MLGIGNEEKRTILDIRISNLLQDLGPHGCVALFVRLDGLGLEV